MKPFFPTRRAGWLVCLSLLAWAWLPRASAQAPLSDKAQSAFDQGVAYASGKKGPTNHVEAAKCYKTAAELGHARAQESLGVCYYRGWGVKRDPAAAVQWFRRAADQGLAAAQYNLANCLESGQGTATNLTEAVRWYRKAADQDDTSAQFNLALMFSRGSGVAKDSAEAARLWSRAANKGHAKSQLTLARCYAEGIGVTQDPALALQWYQATVKNGTKLAANDQSRVDALTKAGAKAPSTPDASSPNLGGKDLANGSRSGAAQTRAKDEAKIAALLDKATPATAMPPIDLSRVSAEQWAGVVTQVKEGMALIVGDMLPSQREEFEARWNPFYEFPAPEVLGYFGKLQPLVAEFVMLREAAGKTAVANDLAQYQLMTALADEDMEAAVSFSYSLKRADGLLLAQAARMKQLAAAVEALGPLPDVEALKKKASKRHQEIMDVASIPPADIEGTWKGDNLGAWTFQILTRFKDGTLLVNSGEGGRGVLQPLLEPNAWLFIQGDEDAKPDKCLYWRLELINDRLRVRSYTPARTGKWYDVGTFKTYLCSKTAPLAKRENYRPEDDTDHKGKPIDWLKLRDERMIAQNDLVQVLRAGGLPKEMEMSRRRAWAAANAESEVNDVMDRMAAEKSIDTDKVDREKAQGRAIERKVNEQYYYYGYKPPGFDNCNSYSQVALQFAPVATGSQPPDLEARARRENILLWNLNLRLQVEVIQAQNEVLIRHGLKPEAQKASVEQIKKDVGDLRKGAARLKDASEKKVADYKDAEAKDIGALRTRGQEELDELEKKRKADLKSIQDSKYYREQPQQRAEVLKGIQDRYNYAVDYVQTRTKNLIAERQAEAKEKVKTAEDDCREQVAIADRTIRDLSTRSSEIESKTVRIANARGEVGPVPVSYLMAEQKRKVEAEFDLPGYVQGLIDRVDEEFPATRGAGTSLSLSSIPGDCQIELPLMVAAVKRVPSSSGKTAAAAKPKPAPAQVPTEAELDRKRREAEAAAKQEKIAAFKEEIAALKKSLEGIEKTEQEIASDDKDKAKKIEGLARDRMVMEANIKAAEDQIRFVETGVYQRSRTSWDDFNHQMMMDDSRATATYWEGVNRKFDRIDRLIEAALPADRDALRIKWNDDVEAAIKAGCKFDRLEKSAMEISQKIQASHREEGAKADAEAARADRKLAIAEGVVTACDYSMTVLTIYATAGLATPNCIFMPLCWESGISTGYSLTTGYLTGGPEVALKQAAGAFSMAAGAANMAMEAYQQGVLNNLEEHARNPQNVKIDETGAGLSAMGWVLGKEGVKMAAMHFVVNPTMVGIKEGLKPPSKFIKNGGGIFGKEEIRFKSAGEMREERIFRDKSLYGKHLMQQFKSAHEEVQAGKAAGKAEAELKPLVEKAESAYKAAENNFQAKNWMKRMAKMNPELGKTWCDFDAVNKGKVIEGTKANLQAQGLSTPDIKCFSNSSSKGKVGMDMDLGFVEPPRWLEVPDFKNPEKTMLVPNPEYRKWRNSLTQTDPVTGVTKVISPRQYEKLAKEAMVAAYKETYGHAPDEDFLDFTYSDHPEAYKDLAWLGEKDGPGWANFCKVNPAQNGQAADVTGFKVNRMQGGRPKIDPKTGKPEKNTVWRSEESDLMPKYSVMVEQSRGIVKDFDTKLLGAHSDTEIFGNEAGNQIRVNPASPLGQMPPQVQQHFLEIRTVLNDLANGRITPSQAERSLYVLTGGQGITEVPQQMKVVMQNFKPAQTPSK